MSAFQEKYAIDKKDNEIVDLQSKSRLQLMIRNVLIGSSLLLVVIAVLIARQFLQKKKSQKYELSMSAIEKPIMASSLPGTIDAQE